MNTSIKTFLYCLTVLSAFIVQPASAQYYWEAESGNSWVGCNNPGNNYCGSTFYDDFIKTKVTLSGTGSSSTATFRVELCSNSTFGATGTYYVKKAGVGGYGQGSPCDNSIGSANISSSSWWYSEVYLGSSSLPSTYNTPVEYYSAVDLGTKYYAGPIRITKWYDTPTANSPSGSAGCSPITFSFSKNSTSVDVYRIQVATSTSGFSVANGFNSSYIVAEYTGSAPNGTTSTSQNLSPGTYYWTVRGARDQIGHSKFTTPVQFTVSNCAPTCTSPTASVNDNTGTGSVNMTCNASGGSGGSILYNWYSGTSCSGTIIGTSQTLSVSSSGYYACKAYISGFENSCYACDYGYATVNTAPTCNGPTTIGSNNIGQTTATVYWSGATNVQYYRLDYRQVGASSWTTINNIPSTATSQNIAGLACSTDYEYRLYTYTSCSGTPYNSSLLNFTTSQCSTPTITVTAPLSGTFTQGGNMTITWNSSNVPSNAPITLQVVNCLNSTVVPPTIVDGTITNVAPQSYTWNNIGLSPGNYRIKIYQTNNPSSVNNNSQLSNQGTGCFTVQAPTCTYSISPNSSTVQQQGGSYTVNVTTQAGCTWSASNNGNSWISVSPASGTGSGTVTVTVSANSGAARSGNITIANNSHTVDQNGVSCTGPSNPSNPVIAANGMNLSWGASSGSPSITYEWIVNQSSTTQSATPIYANGTNVAQASATMAAPPCGSAQRYLWVRAYSSCGNGSWSGWVRSAQPYSPPACCSAPSISVQPTNQSVSSGQVATFTTAVTGGSMPVYYAWYYRANGSAQWTVITGATTLLGNSLAVSTGYGTSTNTSSSLNITTNNANLNGYQFYCKIVPTCDVGLETNSAVRTLNVCANVSVANTDQDDQGNKFILTVLPNTVGATYTWQYRRLIQLGSSCTPTSWTTIASGTSGTSNAGTNEITIFNSFLAQTLSGGLWCSRDYEFRCLISNSCNQTVTSPSWQITKNTLWPGWSIGSILSNAQIIFTGIESSVSYTDETGRTNDWVLSDYPTNSLHDSVEIRYPGYYNLKFAIDYNTSLRAVPMLQDGSTTNRIRYPQVDFGVDNQPFNYINQPKSFTIRGENISGFKVYKLGSQMEFMEPPVYVSSTNDSTGIIPPPSTPGRHWFGFLLTGVDSVVIPKFVDFYPYGYYSWSTVYTPDSLHGAEVYFDGQYLRSSDVSSEYYVPDLSDNLLLFKRLGYRDTTLDVSFPGIFDLAMQPVNHSSLTDSIIHLGVNNTAPRYWKSSTILSNNNTVDVSLKQFDLTEASLSALLPASRVFRFRRLANTASLRAAIVLDQPEFLSNDSIYLLEVKNWNQPIKHLPDEQNFCSYDSAFQKLLLDSINLTANTSTLDYALMCRKAPIALAGYPANTFQAQEDVVLSIPLAQVIADPDSIPNDMAITVLSADNGTTVQVVGNTLQITFAPNFNGLTTIQLSATHDWLTVNNTIGIEVEPVNDAPVIEELAQVNLCSGSNSTVDLSTLISDVDHSLSSVTLQATVTATSNQNVSTNDLTVNVIGHELQLSSSASESTVFTVEVIASDGVSNSQTQTLMVGIVPELNVSIGPANPILCNGETLQLWGNGADDYEWSIQGLTLATTDSFTIDAGQLSSLGITIFNLTLVGTTSGCTGTTELTMSVNDSPTVSVESSNNELCAGDSILLNASGASSYTWNSQEPFTVNGVNQIWATPTASSTYEVIGTNAEGCTDEAEMFITVHNLPSTPVITDMGGYLQSSYPNGNQWYLDGQELSGETDQVLNNPIPGTYTVEYTDANGCSEVSASFNVLVTGISTQNLGVGFEVFPNPNSGAFTVRLFAAKSPVLKLMDAVGRIVSIRTATGNQGTVTENFFGVASGVYILEVTIDEQRHVQRIAVN
ncbi:MAG: T9SS type A sorting domain-containing protein [Flavobacteriales bacterium]|nr:T9SS type A sorting domain-containing protein [Flavobacteriales bacterium]MCB9205517.1 T9SS type A sorting domain-containing protein [Flavobacteriales bacterium]